ncbi:MAG: NifB/NifX family molybdenum-iron cluster-binding protein [Candidatus Cloacimonetes bacterium]|nr:NifB/NifX family molybdenum-iron cluster-binding protein [Candidatus Cloacimonadota bacterium]
MKILFTAQGTGWDAKVDPRFGRCPWLVVVDSETNELTAVDNSDSSEEAHGAGPKTSRKVVELAPAVIITGNGPGGNAATVLEMLDAKIVTGAAGKTLKEAYEAFTAGTL